MALNLNKFDFGEVDFSTPTATQEQPSGSSVLPPIENSQTNVAPVPASESSTKKLAVDEMEEFDQHNASFIASANARYGIEPSVGRNALNYTQLNERIRQDGLKPWEKYAVQQQWLDSLKKYHADLPDGNKKELIGKQIAEIEDLPETLKESEFGGAYWESLGKGVDAFQAGASLAAATGVSHLAVSDSELAKEIEKQKPELYAEKKRIDAEMNRHITEYVTEHAEDGELSQINGADLRAIAYDALSAEDQAKLAEYDKELSARRTDVALRRDVDGVSGAIVKDLRERTLKNTIDANKPSRYVGEDERQDEFNKQAAEGFWGTIKAFVNDPGAGIRVGAKSTGQNAIPQVAGILAGVATRSPMAYQVISSLSNVPAEVQGEFTEALTDAYQKEYGKTDLSGITDEEFKTLVNKYGSNLGGAIDDGFKSASAIMATEALTAKGVGVLASKLSDKAKISSEIIHQAKEAGTAAAKRDVVTKALGITGATALKLTGEGWEEAFGQMASNIALDKPLMEGVGQSFVMALAAVENIPNTIAVSKDAANISKKREEAQTNSQTEEGTKAVEPTEVIEAKGENKTPPAKKAKAPAPKAENIEDAEIVDPQVDVKETVGENNVNTPVNTEKAASEEAKQGNAWQQETPAGELSNSEKSALFGEWSELAHKPYDSLTDGQRNRIQEIEDTFSDKDGNNYFIEALNAWERGDFNENRTDNRDGTTDANGQSVEQGATESNRSGEERSAQAREPVSPTQAEATTEGHRESDTGATENTVEQPHDNTPASDTAGIDGRTGETDHGRGERGELGETGSEQSGKPAEATSETSTSGGVQQRSQSDSVGETLTPQERKKYPSFMSDEEIIGIKERLKNFVEESKKTVNTRKFFAARKGTFKSKAEMVEAMQNAMREHLDDVELNADLFNHASNLIDQHKGRKGWGKNSAKLELPRGAKMSLTNVIGAAEKAHIEAWRAKENESVEENKEKTELLSKIKQVKGTPTAEHISALRDEMRDKKLTEDTDVRGAIQKLVNKLDDSEFELYHSIEDGKRTERRKAAYDVARKEISTPYEKAIEKSNAKRAAIDRAVAEEESRVNPENEFAKSFSSADLRANQKVANKLLAEHPDREDDIKQAFIRATPSARDTSFEAAKRGYIKYHKNNPHHKEFSGTRDGLLGFDFDGNPLYTTPETFYAEIQTDNAPEAVITETLAHAQAIEADHTATINAAVKNTLSRSQFKDDAKAIREEAAKVLGQDKVTNEDLAAMATDKETRESVGEKTLLRKFLDYLNKVLASVIAVVAVGAMTIPQDAHAHTGYGTVPHSPVVAGASQKASDTIHWVVANKDHGGKSFVVADKENGKILVVSPEGKVLDSQNALFGKNKGDSNAFGNTPSGRFQLQKVDTKNLTAADRRVFGDSLLDLADKETGKKVRSSDGRIIAMHRVVNLPERKAALNSATPNDNFLSHGCINIPTAFYNKAVDNLDGAMVYVLNQEEGKQAKAANNTSGRKQFKRSALKWSVAAKDVKAVNISVNKLQATLEKALGDMSKNVRFVTKEDFAENGAFDTLRNAGVEGFYDADSKQVYLVADNIKADKTMSAEERAAWVAWHELFHQGLDVKHGDKLASILDEVSNNPFINSLANAIRIDRMNNELTEISQSKAVEEALAELGAALEAKNLAAIEQRYGVSVPNDYRTTTKSFIGRAVQSIANLVRKIIGKPVFSSKQVMTLLDEAKKAIVPSKEMTALARKDLEDLHSPDSALSGAVSFSIADKLTEKAKDFRDIVVGGDISRTGSIPARDGSKSAKQSSAGQNALSRLWTMVQDSMQIIIDLDPEGNGGKLSNAVATYSNRAQQVARSFRKKAKQFERSMLDFVTENKDLFPKRKNRKQIDHLIQDTTSSLRAITGGNEKIRRNIERTIFGQDIYTDDGQFSHHIPGLIDKKREYEEYLKNNQALNLDVPSYIASKFKQYTEELEKMVAIQDMFDQSDDKILVPASENDTSRKNWRGHDGFTTAEAEAKLAQLKAQGFLDEDVSSLTKEPYTVRKYLGLDETTGEPKFEVVTHYRYKTADVKAKVKGRIMPIAEQYVKLSHEIYAKSVELIGEDIIGKATSEEWETGTMGKVRNVYNINAKDSHGNDIEDVYDVTNANNIDQIISRQQAAEYSSRQNGRAFNGGTASENLTWHIQLMSKQYAAKHVGEVMLEMEKSHPDKIKIYKRNTPEYSLQNGILVVREVQKKGGTEKEVVKVSFANEEANRALFGENIARLTPSDNLVLRAIPALLSSLTRLASAGLTMTTYFGITNAYKGYNEKINQLLAFSADSPFVKAMSPEGQKWFASNGKALDTYAKEAKLQAFLIKNKVSETIGSPLKMLARERAAIIFAQRLVDNDSVAEKSIKWLADLLPFQRQAVEEELKKLELMHATGGISSRVEDLINTSTDLKVRFAAGKKFVKLKDAAKAILDTASTMTMSQELVSSLMMYDLLTGTFGMDSQKAIEANLHFMNFNKRGTLKFMSYIRNYTMFGNAIAQGAKVFQYAYLEQTNNPDDNFLGILPGYRWSGKGTARMVNNVAIAMALNMLARAIADFSCEDNGKQLGNPISGMNPYQLLRDIPIITDCSKDGYSVWRWPVEYGAGNVENALGVAAVQVMTGAWSSGQAMGFVLDSFADNAVPVSIPIAHGGTPFQKAVIVLFPLVPEPLKDSTLAAMGLDNFGNRLNSQVASFKDYKPTAGKKTTDSAWEGVSKALYDGAIFGLNINLTPEETKVLVTSWTKGIFQNMLTYAIENEPKQTMWGTLLGTKSIYRENRGWDKIAYTMAQTYMNDRYQDLTAIVIKAKGLDNTAPTTEWLAKNGYELNDEEMKVLKAITKYRSALANKKASQDKRFHDNVEFIKTIREIEGIK